VPFLYYVHLSLEPPANNKAMTLINRLISFTLLIFIFSTSTVSICSSDIQNRFASLNEITTSVIIIKRLHRPNLFYFIKILRFVALRMALTTALSKSSLITVEPTKLSFPFESIRLIETTIISLLSKSIFFISST